MSVVDLALQRAKYKHLSDDEWRWFLQQVEGKERTADKLPTFASIPEWWYPVRLSCEQCSSELTARYKAEILQAQPVLQCNGLTAERSNSPKDGLSMVDLTGGYGVDTYFLSEQFAHTDYVEQNAELCRIAEHNKGLWVTGYGLRDISIHNSTAEEFLSSLSGEVGRGYDLIFLDPARRDAHGGKVFRLEDCTPNVVELLPTLLSHLTQNGRILLKLSPMLDLTQALLHLTPYTLHLSWDLYVVAIKNEVKELLLLSGGSGQITAIDLDKKDQAFVFTKEEESNSPQDGLTAQAVCQCNGLSGEAGLYLYEPSAAILKAGAYKLIARRFGLHKLDVNTHLYVSDSLVPDFPGRVWKIVEQIKNHKSSIINHKSSIINHKSSIINANVICRNYPLSPEDLKKKLHLRDGGTAFVIGCRVAGKPTVFYAERV